MSELSVYDLYNSETWQDRLGETWSALGTLMDPDNIILQSSGKRNELCHKIRSRNIESHHGSV
ncbi:MAG: hypothetical protein SWH54_16850 [Thermodesulfobacteriota bacterium]|nr:hypothetical protein [Thermodesulfobacteriota bacterium]